MNPREISSYGSLTPFSLTPFSPQIGEAWSSAERREHIEIYRGHPAKPRNAHAVEDKKDRIRAKKERVQSGEE